MSILNCLTCGFFKQEPPPPPPPTSWEQFNDTARKATNYFTHKMGVMVRSDLCLILGVAAGVYYGNNLPIGKVIFYYSGIPIRKPLLEVFVNTVLPTALLSIPVILLKNWMFPPPPSFPFDVKSFFGSEVDKKLISLLNRDN